MGCIFRHFAYKARDAGEDVAPVMEILACVRVRSGGPELGIIHFTELLWSFTLDNTVKQYLTHPPRITVGSSSAQTSVDNQDSF